MLMSNSLTPMEAVAFNSFPQTSLPSRLFMLNKTTERKHNSFSVTVVKSY